MPVYTLKVLSNAALGMPDYSLGYSNDLQVAEVLEMRVLDNDAILDDEASNSWETLDVDGQQALETEFDGHAAGQVVQSVFKQTITNTTTGEIGVAYAIRVYSGTSHDNKGFQVGGYYWASTIDVSVGDVISLSGTNANDAVGNVSYDVLVPCFTTGTLIRTDRGDVPVQELAVGDLVLTRDRGAQPIRWVGSRVLSATDLSMSERLRPIRIRAGALGEKLPTSDLIVSPQHRVLIRSKIAQRMFDAPEVLVAAKQLLEIDGIDIAEDLIEVEYFHFLFDQHEVVISNGAETESLYTGREALRSVGPAAREEILSLFPELKDEAFVSVAARPLLSGRQGRKLAARHAQHQKALVA